MTPLLKKLQYKSPELVYVLNHPAAFEQELLSIKAHAAISTGEPVPGNLNFVLAFVQSQKEIEDTMGTLKDQMKGDAILWFAFPKKTSKRYAVEINRDRGWETLIRTGFAPVRSVSIDADWTALRFRRVEYIKSMTRTFHPASM